MTTKANNYVRVSYDSIPPDSIDDDIPEIQRPAYHKVDTTQAQFTWRAVVVGLLFGTILCFSNLWFGLQSGWISMMSLQSSLVGFAVFKALEHLLDIPFGPAENVVLQSTAVATATMPLAGGFVGILPAFKLLEPEEIGGTRTELNYGQLCAWGLALTFFGVFFAIPLRKQTIIREKLKFPSGTATAQMISVLHNRPDPTMAQEDEPRGQSSAMDADTGSHNGLTRRREDASVDGDAVGSSIADCGDRQPNEGSSRSSNGNGNGNGDESIPLAVDDVRWVTKLVSLFVAFVLSGTYALLAHFFPIVSALPIFGNRLSKVWAWNLTPSLSYAGQGIIMGLPTCIWMLVGSVVGWGILSPLAKNMGWAPGEVSDWKTGSRGWILWISLAVMIAESVISLGLVAAKEARNAYVRVHHTISARRRPNRFSDNDTENTANYQTSLTGTNELDSDQTKDFSEDHQDMDVDPRFLVPGWVTWTGLAASTLLCMGIVYAIFDIPMYDTLIAVLLALPLAVLGVRALGETDLNPVSGIGKVSQVVFAGIMPGNIVGNLVAGGIAEAGAQQAGDLMQDLKTGHLLNASPRAQFVAQMIGSVFSVFITAGAYILYNKVYTIPGPELPAPTAQVWLDMARLVNGHPLPPHVWPFITVFAVVFIALPVAALFIDRANDVIVLGPLTIRKSTLQRWWPSGIAFAIGIYNTPNFTLMRAIGAIGAACITEAVVARERKLRLSIGTDDRIWNRQEPLLRRKVAMMAIIVASGFVLGEGTFSFFILLSQAFSK
ncbi:OPT super [Coemansia erecta]|uniref:OPT super n=1 Tax=Coemansia erecta TaxID=147472 RepID=A0A9W7Y6Z8_9FUNG|nr:OPT super [Coemansia erecta]